MFEVLIQIRKKLVRCFHKFEEYFIVDSIPLEVCKFLRASRSKICREAFDNSPIKEYCTSQSIRYFGCKLHADCLVKGIIVIFDLSKASVPDFHI